MGRKYDISGTSNIVPLISFDCIFDLDIGLVMLIYNKYLDNNVFNKDFFERPAVEIIKDLYLRKEENPLKIFAKDKDNPKLDIYYEEFIHDKKKEICELSVITNMMSLFNLFESVSEITPTILCKDEIELDIVKGDAYFKKFKTVLISELIENRIIHFDQLYVKYLNDIRSFEEIWYTNIYISSARLNFLENFDYADIFYVDELLKQRNHLSIYDIYNSTVLGKDSLR